MPHILIIVALFGDSGRPRMTAPPEPPTTGYVADGACTACHRALAHGFSEVGMGRSFQPFRADAAIEDFVDNHYFHRPSNRHYEMTLEEGRMVITRYRMDTRGIRYAVRRQTADFVVGSGNHSRGYLYRLPTGDMFQMPIAWYTQSGRWGMAPGFDTAQHEDFDRMVTRQCMFCHNAYPQYTPGSDAFGQPHRFPKDLPAGIGCQRCHGPGARHVNLAASDDAPVGAVRDSIVNPARLSAERRDDVCLQCHLQPTSRRTSFIRRFGRADYSFQPGETLSDYLVHLDIERSPAEDPFEINHHPYRLHQSTCYTASSGRLHCVTCHDPHHKVAPDDRAAHYRQRCLGCHGQDDCGEQHPAGAAAADCTACHMPRRRTDDVIHVVMTDHRIQRRGSPAALDPRHEQATPEGAARPFRPRGPALDVYAALADAADFQPASLQRLVGTVDAAGGALEFDFQLGLSQFQAGDLHGARSTFERIVEHHPQLASARLNLGRAYAATGAATRAAAAFRSAARLDPNLAEAHYNLATLVGRLDPAEGERHYRIVLALRPGHARAALNLGNLLGRQGALEEAVALFDAAVAADPDLTAAYVSGGAARRNLGRWDSAITTWQNGLTVLPQNPMLAVELAWAHLIHPQRTRRDRQAAYRYAQMALTIDPHQRQARETMVLLAALDGDTVRVTRLLDAAGAVGPRAVLLKALVHKDQDTLARTLAAHPQPADPMDRVIRQVAREALREPPIVDKSN